VRPRTVTLPSGAFAELVKAIQEVESAAIERSVETIARAAKAATKCRRPPARKCTK
jgi:hypothetical protein